MSLDLLKEDLNKRWGLPFKKTGDKHKGKDYSAKYIAEDKYELTVQGANLFYPGVIGSLSGGLVPPIYMGISAGVAINHSAMHNTYTIDAKTMAQVYTNMHLPHMGLFRITKEDEAKLAELKKELEQHKKLKKIELFKSLPANIRQSIVDDMTIEDFANTLESKANGDDFDGLAEIKRLEAMRPLTMTYQYGSSFSTATMHIDYMHVKYGKILQHLSKEEIIAAHLEKTLEDEISE
jgi:hypothetical protein